MRVKLLGIFPLLAVCLSAFAQTDGQVYASAGSEIWENRRITSVVEDGSKYIWFGTTRGLLRYNGSRYHLFLHQGEGSLNNDYIRCLCPDNAGRLWVGTNTGIDLIVGNRIIRTDAGKQNIISCLLDWNARQLLCADSNGLGLYEKEDGASRVVNDMQELGTSDWLLPLNGGGLAAITRGINASVYILDSGFKLVCESKLSDMLLRHACMASGDIYLATGKGLLRMDAGGRFLPLPPVLRQITEGQDILWCEGADRRGSLFLAVRGKGFFEYHFSDENLERYPLLAQTHKEKPLSGTVTEKAVWLSFADMPVRIPLEKQASPVYPLPGLSGGEFAYALKSDDDGESIYVKTSLTQYRYYPRTGEMVEVPDVSIEYDNQLVFPFYPPHFSMPDQNCSLVDRNGALWIGTEDHGLVRYDPSSGQLRTFTPAEGLPGTGVRSMLEDSRGQLWMALRSEIVRLNPQDFHFTKYYIPNLDIDRFVPRSAALLPGPDERIVFGGEQSLVIIDSAAEAYSGEVQPELEALYVNGQLQDLETGPVTLDYKQDQLTFYYSAMNFEDGPRLNYAYKLDGYDRNWMNAGQNLSATYSSVPAGRYSFRVRVQTPDGQWTESQESIRLRVKPAPWFSPLAILLYCLLAISLLILTIYGVIHERLSKERIDSAEREKRLSEQLNKEKIQFFTNIAHEFRTPLSLIYGPAMDLERDSRLSGEERKLAGLIADNASRMMNLSNQLLSFNSRKEGVEKLQVAHYDIGALMHTVLDNFAYLAEQKGIALQPDIPDSLPAYCDQEKVMRILSNLVSNAVKYTPRGGRVAISTIRLPADHAARLFGLDGHGSPFLELRVDDTGIGIPKESVDQIFLRFERLKEAVDQGEVPEGFGVGLNYAMYLAGLHHGCLQVSANEPKGSRFSFIFPVGKDAYGDDEIWVSELPDGPSQQTTSYSGNNPDATVLIVEDHPDVRAYIHDFLAPQYHLQTASNGLEAWERIRESAPDIVVSDVMMPYKDGFVLCKELKDSPEYCHIPVILLTARTASADQVHGLNMGADAYIPKPFDPDVFKATLGSLIANRRRIQARQLDSTTLTEESSRSLGVRDKAFLDKLYQLVEAGLSDENLSLESIADEMGMSYSAFFNKVKGLVGTTPQKFLITYRLNRAKQLWESGQYNVSEVCYQVGFAALGSFSRSFKNKFGVSPSEVLTEK